MFHCVNKDTSEVTLMELRNEFHSLIKHHILNFSNWFPLKGLPNEIGNELSKRFNVFL